MKTREFLDPTKFFRWALRRQKRQPGGFITFRDAARRFNCSLELVELAVGDIQGGVVNGAYGQHLCGGHRADSLCDDMIEVWEESR